MPRRKYTNFTMVGENWKFFMNSTSASISHIWFTLAPVNTNARVTSRKLDPKN